MSHTAHIETKLMDAACIEKACERLGISCALNSSAKFYDGEIHNGTVVKINGWRYPIVISENGTVHMDNFNGSWGNITDFNTLKMYYGAEKAKKEARKKGYRCREEKVGDKLKVHIFTN